MENLISKFPLIFPSHKELMEKFVQTDP